MVKGLYILLLLLYLSSCVIQINPSYSNVSEGERKNISASVSEFNPENLITFESDRIYEAGSFGLVSTLKNSGRKWTIIGGNLACPYAKKALARELSNSIDEKYIFISTDNWVAIPGLISQYKKYGVLITILNEDKDDKYASFKRLSETLGFTVEEERALLIKATVESKNTIEVIYL